MDRRSWIVMLVVLLVGGGVKAQDPHFSQYFAAPLYLSPSMAGSSGTANITMNYRNMWPGIKTAYETYAVSADFYMGHYNSGFGFLAYQDKAGSAALTNTYMGGQYSYRLTLSRDWQLVPAFQCAVGQNSIDFSSLMFGDELSNGYGGSDGRLTLFEYGDDNNAYFDLAVSVLAASQKLWLGVTFNHLTTPEYSFLGDDAKLGLKAVCFGGYNVWTERVRRGPARNVSFNWRYEMQHQFKQLDLGFYWYNENLDYGIWYRGIPWASSEEKISWNNRDALVFIIQYKSKVLKLGYSYDLTISDLSAHSIGAHEISLAFDLTNLNFVKRLTSTSLSCFPVGKDGRYYTRSRRKVVR